ncbi:hypothetical protein [uncultured Vagococcus sp.]|uniref:hypothetical protein n=1 Tax=uncultured Vagococcus sp. TaxID=189676 RepID=UPI0028D078BB|nr:hypothetical protein [uncultured Vagococcus sp.]
MKKIKWAVLLTASLILTACQPKKDETPQTTATTVSSSIADSASSTESNYPTTKEQPTNDPEEQAQAILKRLSDTIPTALPQKILTAQDGHFLSAATAQDNAIAVNYYATEQPIPLNDTHLNQLTPIARFTKTTYGTEVEAKEAVNYVPVNTAGQPVDLGHAITGYQDAGAGSVFLSWQEGNWSLTVRGVNLDGEDPVPLAKEVVEQLETASLPAPQNVGQINLRVSNKEGEMAANTLTWQEGTTVYLLEHHDPKQVIHMALSLK